MPEDAGKKKFIKDFIIRIQGGAGFIEDIWIDRVIKPPGTEGEGSTARSFSGKLINNVTQLLEDDLQHSFEQRYFTFRFIAALVGSGKTSLLTYLQELTKAKENYRNFSVVCRFPLSDLLTIGGVYRFSIQFYCYILAKTFWELLNNSSLLVKTESEKILRNYLEDNQIYQLKSADDSDIFLPKFINFFAKGGIDFKSLFFKIIDQISSIEPRFTFVYLIDELDSLQPYPNEIQEIRTLLKAMIKEACDTFKSKIGLLIYIVGTTENVNEFINGDSVIKSHVGHWVINLNGGYGNELEIIRTKIDERIEGAFKGYKDFSQAWQEIKKIPIRKIQITPAQDNLRTFCQEYSTAILEIYEKYFQEAPEQRFEGNARELVEAQCRRKWEPFLRQRSYTLSSVSTTTIIKSLTSDCYHAFDCYIELLHNGICVAKGFGEAKNYELLSSHLETFHQWLQEVGFRPLNNNGHPNDLAFMIAPACPSLLQRKLELKNIHFIRSDKVIIRNNNVNEVKPNPSSVDINTADKHLIIDAFKGSRITEGKIDQLIANRKIKPYKNLDELVTKLKLTKNARTILQAKIDENKICFLVE